MWMNIDFTPLLTSAATTAWNFSLIQENLQMIFLLVDTLQKLVSLTFRKHEYLMEDIVPVDVFAFSCLFEKF